LDIVDVKKPDEGSLGANFPWVIRDIRDVVPADKPVSATVGDVPYKPGTVAQAALGAVVSGATYIKVGLYGCTTPDQGIEVMRAVVRAVKDHRPDALVVASGYADAHRIGCVNPLSLPDIASRSGADAAMLDTAIKDGTRLFDHVPPDACAEFVRLAHAAGLLAALAGSVQRTDLASLTRIGTDIVGVRGAVCEGGDRNAGRIRPHLVAAFRAEMDQHARAHAADTTGVGRPPECPRPIPSMNPSPPGSPVTGRRLSPSSIRPPEKPSPKPPTSSRTHSTPSSTGPTGPGATGVPTRPSGPRLCARRPTPWNRPVTTSPGCSRGNR